MVPEKDLSARILLELANLGLRARIVPAECLGDLEADIMRLYKQGLLGDEFCRQYIPKFVFSPPKNLPEARSIIVISAPHTALKVTFTVDGHPFETTVPPTYTDDSDRLAYGCIREVLEPEGYRLANASLPKKLLAVRSGLGDYGKNNIVYVEDLGSYHRLAAFYTDAPLRYGKWRQPEMLEQCKNCEACIKKCPSGAISADRFLLDAERCITFYNETEGEFPDWINPTWHTCLVGCMACQDICPENQRFWKEFEHVAEFDEAETRLFLEQPIRGDLGGEILDKLRRFGMHEEYYLIPKNLKALVNRQEKKDGTY